MHITPFDFSVVREDYTPNSIHGHCVDAASSFTYEIAPKHDSFFRAAHWQLIITAQLLSNKSAAFC